MKLLQFTCAWFLQIWGVRPQPDAGSIKIQAFRAQFLLPDAKFRPSLSLKLYLCPQIFSDFSRAVETATQATRMSDPEKWVWADHVAA